MKRFHAIAFTSVLTVLSFNASSAEFTNSQLCKAAISVEMSKEPSIMKVRERGDLVDLQYIRANDGTKWKYQCKIINGDQIMWRTAGDDNTPNRIGRWRDHPLDSTIKFSISGNTLTISESELGDTTFEQSELK
ncbi:hypothetical protein [Erwinia persicina]|uniref:DUF2541 domain-containing protein n=1 Tax=Erwinia persicina TaxID=55211 RepID=A0A4U3FL05_9GAMM|nr:hypothetical protein [Erwinia persicina]TKJ94803.1 hypothetical protein EpCFBP13511_00100 [Erwinia persicina]